MRVALLVMDVVYLSVAIAMYSLAVWCGDRTIALVSPLQLFVPLPLYFVLALFAGLIAGYSSLLAIVAVLLRLMPRLQPGRHRMGSKFFIIWMVHFLLRRVLLPGPVQPFVFSINVLRWITLRALRARIPFSTSLSTDVVLLDPSLLTAGEGCVIGSRVFMTGHALVGKWLFLGAHDLGDSVVLAGDVSLAMGVRLGDRVFVRPLAKIGPGCRLGKRVDVGVSALLEGENVIADDTKIPTNAFLALKAELAPPRA